MAYDVVDRARAAVARALLGGRFDGTIARQEWSLVVLPLDEAVDSLAVGEDGGALDTAELIFLHHRLLRAGRPARHGPPVGGPRVPPPHRDVFRPPPLPHPLLHPPPPP